jgi:outer membrane protein assembly factor BamA
LVRVDVGARFRIRIEGNQIFDTTELTGALELDELEDPSPEVLRARIREFYEQRGYFDAVVLAEDRVGAQWTDRVLVVREGAPVRVVSRTYPCLRGFGSTSDVDEEVDGVLSEALPGGDDLVGPPPAEVVDEELGTRGGHRAEAISLEPWRTYSQEAYERVVNHLSDLYRAEGYLSALVGPVSVLRRRCSPLSQPGRCEPVGVRAAPASICPTPSNPLPVEDPELDDSLQCRPDPLKGVRCEPNVVLSIPIKLGPRTTLWNLEFTGNEQVLEDKLAEVADLKLGQPVSQVGLQQARRRILDHYADLGYAFAGVDVELQLSQDRTRGSARFVVSEREQVQITAIVVRGAERTSESLILGRLELIPGGVYRRSLVRQSEEQLATLGVFSSVTIGLEDPEVPAKRKVVIVHVAERLPQYVDVKPGFSTGEGARVTFEYGHRNLFGKAVQLTLRVQLGYLPGWLIFEDSVRRNFEELDLGDRLERRDTATIELPVGKRYRLAFDGVDARDNSRDFGITKRALIVTLTHRYSRHLSLVAGASFELNDAGIFGDTQNLQEYLEANPEQVRLLNVPEGGSQAVAVRGGATLDFTDNPLGPTRGFFTSGEVEPVVAYLDEDNAAVQLERCEGAGNDPATCEFKSRFLKTTGRVAGYIPFNDEGLSLALSVRAGANFQLVDNSSTYPDRLFFMGGADSLRGFLQASLIPQDIAEQLQREDPDAPDQEDRLTARKVVIRGGDFLLNPRIELRIPITKLLHTALFVDSGNLWRDIANVDPTVLRYTAGSGLRFVTPVGPLAFDYGVKLDRRFYETDVGAFHFSVGLF